mmetsp:Transcript_31086/g.49766  ORF Transcript_31086/g.49766 Transcript_31086/m.49766 type:complete len:109 (-) Transcript_31086:731-1057(-)
MKVKKKKIPVQNTLYMSINLEIFKMMVEGGSFLFVEISACSVQIVCHVWGTTAEYTKGSDVWMLIFHRLQEIPEIWTSKMSDGTKTSEQTFSRYLLEMSLTDVQHGGS